MELTKNIILRRLQLVGHVMRMKDERIFKKASKGYRGWRRPFGRPRRVWIDAVNRDAKILLKCKNRRCLEAED